MLEGRNSLILMAVALITAGLLLRWDLVDWIIDAEGAIFVLGGVAAGVLAIVKSLSARSSQTSRPTFGVHAPVSSPRPRSYPILGDAGHRQTRSRTRIRSDTSLTIRRSVLVTAAKLAPGPAPGSGE